MLNSSSDTEFQEGNDSDDTPSVHERLLHASRNGETDEVKEILEQYKQGSLDINLNCKGTHRSNKGWSPLHLAAYFGHAEVVKLLLEAGADVNVQNNMGDTPLHRAAYTAREDIVMLLLSHGADISILNTEGHTPKTLATSPVKRFLEASERSDSHRMKSEFLSSCLHGQIEIIKEMVRQPNAPDINITDKFGNTALHMAALRNQKQVAILLLQLGIDTSMKNNNGQRALDLTSSPQMKQLLNVRPVQDIPIQSGRQEGPILKKSRFFGFKPMWMVLEKGVLSYFNNRGDASTGGRRKGFKYLDHATITTLENAPMQFKVSFSDGTSHTLCIDPLKGDIILKQKWLVALKEHIDYTNHYMNQGNISDEEREENLRNLQDSLMTAHAHQEVLGQLLTSVTSHFSEINKESSSSTQTASFISIHQSFHEILDTSREMYTSLTHCTKLVKNQEMVFNLQLEEEKEKSRVLEEALHALATEHHQLERSITSNHYRSCFYDTDDDEFYDCDNDSRSIASAGDFMSVFEGSMSGSFENFPSTPTKDEEKLEPDYFTSDEVLSQLSLQKVDLSTEYTYRVQNNLIILKHL